MANTTQSLSVRAAPVGLKEKERVKGRAKLVKACLRSALVRAARAANEISDLAIKLLD